MGGKCIDITGEVYGKLTVIEFVDSDRKNKTTLWKCQCSCENKTILIVSSHSLRRKKKGRKSCGCAQKDVAKESMIDMVGQKFGRWTVIALDTRRHKTQQRPLWICECSCKDKKRKSLKRNTLVSGASNSCGCLRKEQKSFKHKDWTGKKIGKLTVIKELGRNKRNDRLWLCRCSCKNKKEVIKSSGVLSTGNSRSCGCTTGMAIRKTWASKIENLSGRKYGKLTVIKMIPKRKEGFILWLCSCSCSKNKKVIVQGKRLKSGAVASCGCMRESLVSSDLKEYYKNNNGAIPEYKELRNPKTNYFLPYDIYIPKYRLYIEVQGIQHYEYKKHFSKTKENFEYQKYKDRIKKEHAKKNGIFLEIDLRKNMTTKEWILFINKKIMEIENNGKHQAK